MIQPMDAGGSGGGRPSLTRWQRIQKFPYTQPVVTAIDSNNPFGIKPQDLPDWSHFKYRRVFQSRGPNQPIEEAVRPFRSLLRAMGYRALGSLSRWELSCAQLGHPSEARKHLPRIWEMMSTSGKAPRYWESIPLCWYRAIAHHMSHQLVDFQLDVEFRANLAAFGCYRGILVMQLHTTDWLTKMVRYGLLIFYLSNYFYLCPEHYTHPSRIYRKK